MWRTSRFGILLTALLSISLLAAEPALLPGEGLALAVGGPIRTRGEADRITPMGSLAKLVWLRREGAGWENQGLVYTCRGAWGGWSCWNRDGHGRVDLAGAARASCNLAFLVWAMESLQTRRRILGESAARANLETDFRPFLEHRLPASETLPRLTPAWVGAGDLLRSSPAAFLRWLQDPAQAGLRLQCARMLPDRAGWWVKTGTAAVPGDPGATCAWVAGGNGTVLAVLRVPRGRGKAEGLARFRALVEDPDP